MAFNPEIQGDRYDLEEQKLQQGDPDTNYEKGEAASNEKTDDKVEKERQEKEVQQKKEIEEAKKKERQSNEFTARQGDQRQAEQLVAANKPDSLWPPVTETPKFDTTDTRVRSQIGGTEGGTGHETMAA